MPLHDGPLAGVLPTNVALTVRPQASVIFAGAPGSTAADVQDTVELPFCGAVKPPE